MGSFSASVDAWVRQTKERSTAVFRESAERVIEIAQTPVGVGGNMPVDTGFLRASVRASLNGSLAPLRDNPGKPAAFDGGAVSLTITNAKLGDVITVSYGANYARHVEYGARGRPARAFVRLAAQRWPQIVAEVSREAKGRAGA